MSEIIFIGNKLYARKAKITWTNKYTGVTMSTDHLTDPCRKKELDVAAKNSLAAMIFNAVENGLSLYQTDDAVVGRVEGENPYGFYCTKDTIKTTRDMHLNLLVPYAAYMITFQDGDKHVQTHFVEALKAHADNDQKRQEDEILTFCDCLYYETVKGQKRKMSYDSSMKDEEVDAAIRAAHHIDGISEVQGMLHDVPEYNPALDEAAKPAKEISSSTSTMEARWEEMKNGSMRLPFPLDEDQKKYVKPLEILEKIVPTMDLFYVIDLMKAHFEQIFLLKDAGKTDEEINLECPPLNISITGKPGTGKTQMAMCVSAILGMPFYDVVGSKNTDESFAEGGPKITEDGAQFCDSFISANFNRASLIDCEEQSLIPAGVSMVLSQALEAPYVINRNGINDWQVTRSPFCVFFRCENEGITGTNRNSPALSNRYDAYIVLDDPDEDLMVKIMQIKTGAKKNICKYVYDAYTEIVDYAEQSTEFGVDPTELKDYLSIRNLTKAVQQLVTMVPMGYKPLFILTKALSGVTNELSLEFYRGLERAIGSIAVPADLR